MTGVGLEAHELRQRTELQQLVSMFGLVSCLCFWTICPLMGSLSGTALGETLGSWFQFGMDLLWVFRK